MAKPLWSTTEGREVAKRYRDVIGDFYQTARNTPDATDALKALRKQAGIAQDALEDQVRRVLGIDDAGSSSLAGPRG